MMSKKEGIKKLGVICRICLKGDGPMFSIFASDGTENDEEPILATRITSIAQVQVRPGDGMPNSICQSCRRQVDKFYDFRCLVEISDRALRSYLEETGEENKSSCQAIEGASDLDYHEFLVENTADDPKDLFTVNTILVPSESGTETWQICSVEGEIESDKSEPETIKRIVQKSVYARQINNLEKRDATERRKILSRKVQPVAIIDNIQDKEPYILTATTSNEIYERESSGSEELTSIMIIEDENNEEEEIPSLPLNKYSCQLCLKPFKSLRTLKSHVKDHFFGGKERIQICDVEKKKVRSSTENSNFKFEEKEPRSYPEINDSNCRFCRTCDRIFETSEEFFSAKEKKTESDRLNLRENNRTTDNDNEFCKECGSRNEELRKSNGDRVVSSESSLTCKTCDKQFRNAQSFKMHLKRHTLGSRFNCLECGKSYYSNSELARHAQLHTGTREYPCHLCEMSFFSKPELNRHTKYHNGEKKFQCKICFKTYYESGHLKVHERVHTGEKPFPCSVCDKAFITKSKLIRHFKIHDRDRSS